MQYVNKGKCVFCLKKQPEVNFSEKPHTMPRSLGSESIGFDICNDCNHYFGQPDKLSVPQLCIEVCVKEVFGMIKHLLNTSRSEEYGRNNRMRSIFFEYRHSESKIKIKSSFQYNHKFLHAFTNQFKRGLYEMFLQEYHKVTQNGLDTKFNEIREYARFNQGNIPVYYMQNNGVFLLEDDISNPRFNFSESQFQTIDNYGFYTLMLWGQIFFLEVTPRARLCRNVYLRNEASKLIGTGFVFKGLIELQRITDIDFTLRSLLGKKL